MTHFVNKFVYHQKAVWLILALALALRLPHLGGSFWLDEAAQALESVRPLSQQFDIAGDFQPPLLHLIVHFASYFSHSEWWLRMIGAVIPGLITIWATIKIGEVLHHPRSGLLAGVLLATSPFHIFFSQELRPYSLPALFATVSWLILFRWPKSDSVHLPHRPKNPSLKQLTLFAVVTAAGLYSSYLYPFLLLGQGTYVLWSRRTQLLPFILSAGFAGASFLPWLPFFLEQLRVGGELRRSLPGWDEVVSLTQLKSLPLVFAKFIFGLQPLSLEPVLVLAAALLLVSGMVLLVNAWQRQKLHHNLIPLFIWIGVPLISAWVISFFVPVIQPKRVLMLLPAMYLSFALLTSKYLNSRGLVAPNFWQRMLHKSQPLRAHLAASLLLLTLFALNLIGTAKYYLDPTLQRENWRELFYTVQAKHKASETVVIFSFPDAFAPWRWYELQTQLALQNTPGMIGLQGKSMPTILATGEVNISEVPNLTRLLAPVAQYEDVLVFDYLRDLTDPDDRIPRELTTLHYENTEVLDYPNIGFVRLYEPRN